MADDKPMLTRRRVLGGMATVGAAGAVGAGAYAQTDDQETVTTSVTAGDLNMKVENGSGNFVNGPVSVSVDNVQSTGSDKADGYRLERDVKNVGDVTGNYLCASITNLSDSENGRSDAEMEAGDESGGSGDLAQYLDVRVDLIYNTHEDRIVPQDDLNTLAGSGECYAIDDNDLESPLAPGDTQTLRITVLVADENISDAMGDSVTFDVNPRLYSTNPT